MKVDAIRTSFIRLCLVCSVVSITPENKKPTCVIGVGQAIYLEISLNKTYDPKTVVIQKSLLDMNEYFNGTNCYHYNTSRGYVKGCRLWSINSPVINNRYILRAIINNGHVVWSYDTYCPIEQLYYCEESGDHSLKGINVYSKSSNSLVIQYLNQERLKVKFLYQHQAVLFENSHMVKQSEVERTDLCENKCSLKFVDLKACTKYLIMIKTKFFDYQTFIPKIYNITGKTDCLPTAPVNVVLSNIQIIAISVTITIAAFLLFSCFLYVKRKHPEIATNPNDDDENLDDRSPILPRNPHDYAEVSTDMQLYDRIEASS